jgi:hypothetical protein
VAVVLVPSFSKLNVSSVHWHVPFVHVKLPLHEPHEPPQPSDPHSFPEQEGVHAHAPDALHVVPVPQPPHEPPQPSGPHCLPPHEGEQTQAPAALQLSPAAQLPHMAPQPSGPHCFPAHDGSQPPLLEPEALLPELPPELPLLAPQGDAQLSLSHETRLLNAVMPDWLLLPQSCTQAVSPDAHAPTHERSAVHGALPAHAVMGTQQDVPIHASHAVPLVLPPHEPVEASDCGPVMGISGMSGPLPPSAGPAGPESSSNERPEPPSMGLVTIELPPLEPQATKAATRPEIQEMRETTT